MNKDDTKYINYVWKYLEGELSGEELKIFKDELKTNPTLFTVYLKQSEIFEALSKTETIELRKQLKNISFDRKTQASRSISGNTRNMWYLAAASFVIICTLGYLVFHFAVRSMDMQISETVTLDGKKIPEYSAKSKKFTKNNVLDTGRIPENDQHNNNYFQDFSDNHISIDTEREQLYNEWFSVVYQENPMLEHFLEINYRSDLMDLYLPEPNHVYALDDTIVFYWKPEIDTLINLTIINNRSVEVYHTILRGKQLIIFTEFSPGLYYWRIDTEKDNILSGKFVVENE